MLRPEDLKVSDEERGLNARQSDSGAAWSATDPIAFRWIYPKEIPLKMKYRDGPNPKYPDASAWLVDGCSALKQLRINFPGNKIFVFAFPSWLEPYMIENTAGKYIAIDLTGDVTTISSQWSGTNLIGCRFRLRERCAGRRAEVERARTIYHQNGYSKLTAAQQALLAECGCGTPEAYAMPSIPTTPVVPVATITTGSTPSGSIAAGTVPGGVVSGGVVTVPVTSGGILAGVIPSGFSGVGDPIGSGALVAGAGVMGDSVDWFPLFLLPMVLIVMVIIVYFSEDGGRNG